MTTDPNTRRSRDAAADAASDEAATDAIARSAASRQSHDLAGLDVFSADNSPNDGPEADATDDETLEATTLRAAVALPDAVFPSDPDPDVSAPARELPVVRARPGDVSHDDHGQVDKEDDEEAGTEEAGVEEAGTEEAGAYAYDDGEDDDEDEDEDEDDDEDEGDDEGDKTVIAQVTPRPRTLSAAFRQSHEEVPPPEAQDTPPRDATLPPFPVPLPLAVEPEPGDADDEIDDDLDPEEEWAVADQPTIYLPPQRRMGPSGPTAKQEGWSYRPQARPGQGRVQGQPPTGPRPGIVRASPPLRRFAPIPTPRSGYAGPRLATPKGQPMPATPPDGVPPAAMADPRMERFRELRGSRAAHDQGARTADEARPVSAIVRQWWGDLLPGLRGALRHQHEAQASGVHPASPYEAAPSSRLGDAFGRLTQSARDLTDRARPALQRIHDQAEHAAQAIVGRFDQPTAVQQAPFLGPGRVAIFFKAGVTVGQAHALLMRRQARPMRLIPRKHGFLAAVAPGREEEICDGLRDHPYVRDVAYIAYDRTGKPVSQQEA